MKQVHMTLAPKGGIGKSLVATLLTQWLRDSGQAVVAFDNDPATATLQSYKSLDVRKLELVREGVVNKHAYDEMFMAMTTEDAAFVVDNGASNFLELTNYIEASDLFEVLASVGLQPYVHVPLVGGDDCLLTVGGADRLATVLPPVARIVVWHNLYKGPIAYDGVAWEKMEAYKRHARRFHAEVSIAKRDDMTNAAVEKMLTRRDTFAEVMASNDYNLLDKSRLSRVKADVYEQLTQLIGTGRNVEAA